ncbi:uncharacterized protein V6R79_000056 [Siganus canaliculatus]
MSCDSTSSELRQRSWENVATHQRWNNSTFPRLSILLTRRELSQDEWNVNSGLTDACELEFLRGRDGEARRRVLSANDHTVQQSIRGGMMECFNRPDGSSDNTLTSDMEKGGGERILTSSERRA